MFGSALLREETGYRRHVLYGMDKRVTKETFSYYFESRKDKSKYFFIQFLRLNCGTQCYEM